MATPILRRSDLALLSDPVTHRVAIPHLTAAARQTQYAGSLVTFAGDTYPTPFRSPARQRSWSLTCLFGGTEQQSMADLLALLDLAAGSPDSRLLLRTHIGAVGGLDPVTAVVVLAVDVTPRPGMIHEVGMTATAVQWTPGV